MNIATVAIVGRPNVGKSTLFNRIVGGRRAIVDDRPGVTRDRHFATASWGGKDFWLVDTGGWDATASDALTSAIRQQIGVAVDEADVIILSALVPGEVAPVLITEKMVQNMKPGSVIIDVSIDQGGNCEITEPGHDCVKHRVHLCGLWNIPGSMPVHASWLYAHNILHYVENLFKNGLDAPDYDDEIVRHSLVAHQGQIVHQGMLKALNKG